MCMNVNEYWERFLKDNNLDENTEYFDAFCFYGFTKKQTEELTELVLSDKKKATTSIYLESEKYPEIGSYSIVLDSDERPVCITRTTDIHIMKFKEMTFEIASREGEDECLDTWIDNHSRMFREESKELGYVFDENSLIFFEEFEVIYR